MPTPYTPFVRPLRIPETAPLGTAAPSVAKAGEKGTWTLTFTLAAPVAGGEILGLQCHGGRNNKSAWQGLQIEDASREGYVSLKLENGEPLSPAEEQGPEGTFYVIASMGGLRAGERIEVTLGGSAGAVAPEYALPNKFFLLFVPLPEEDTGVPKSNAELRRRVLGACLVHVIGNRTHHLRTYARSQVRPGEPTSVLVRPEDENGNVACDTPGPLVVRVGGEEIASRRVSVDDSTCCVLDGIVLKTPGIYRLEIEDQARGLNAQTNPIRCGDGADTEDTYWGIIHAHTEISDGAGSLDHLFRYMRDECLLDFGATGDHDHLFETSDEMWKRVQDAVVRYHTPGQFVTFLGYEWAKWRRNGDGDRNVYYLHDHRPLFRSDDGHHPAPPDLFRALREETAIVIPHHPAEIGNHCDWKDHDPEKERLVEIYSCWGNSERSVHEGNPCPVRPSGHLGDQDLDAGEVPEGFVQRALALGWRVGFTGGGDDHLGHPGDEIRIGWGPWRYKAGLMAVRAADRTREAIWDAMWSRHTYATTGPRILVDFVLNGHPMGSELFLSDHPELTTARKIAITVHGTDAVQRVEIVRNNREVYVHETTAPDVTFEWEDTDTLDAVHIPPGKFWPTPFTFYYVRVTQRDDEMAWTSPVWISPSKPVAG